MVPMHCVLPIVPLQPQEAHIRFDFKRIEGYRHFCNKLWNAARYVLMNTEGKFVLEHSGHYNDKIKNLNLDVSERWIFSIWQKTKQAVQQHLHQYRFDLAAQALYEFTWNEYCDWYLELSKAALLGSNASEQQDVQAVRFTLVTILEELLRCLHSLIPYITEEIWQRIRSMTGKQGETIMLEPYPEADIQLIDPLAEADIEWIKAMILGIRNIRGEMNIAPGKQLAVLLQQGDNGKLEDSNKIESLKHQNKELVSKYGHILQSLGKMSSLTWLSGEEGRPLAATALVGSVELLVPMADLIEKEAEMARLEKEIDKLKKELEKIDSRLSNQNFVANAPVEVVNQEKKRGDEISTAIEKLNNRKIEISKLEVSLRSF